MAIAIFGLPKNCNFCHFYIHTLVAIATCATKQEGKKKPSQLVIMIYDEGGGLTFHE